MVGRGEAQAGLEAQAELEEAVAAEAEEAEEAVAARIEAAAVASPGHAVGCTS